jgi:hypothetical protein
LLAGLHRLLNFIREPFEMLMQSVERVALVGSVAKSRMSAASARPDGVDSRPIIPDGSPKPIAGVRRTLAKPWTAAIIKT